MTQWLYVIGAIVVVWAVWSYVLRPRIDRRSDPVDEQHRQRRAEADAARDRRQMDKGEHGL